MTSCTLHRIDPARRMARFYALDVQRDLFGVVVLVKAWGRIGSYGHVVSEAHPTEARAVAALQRHMERKQRRGYQLPIVAEAEKLATEQGRATPRAEG